jgi:hypothetical protein
VNAGLTCTWDQVGAVRVPRLVGRLNVKSAATVRATLHKSMAEQPAAMVIDLGEMVVHEDIALTVFTAFAHTAAFCRPVREPARLPAASSTPPAESGGCRTSTRMPRWW